MKTFNDLWCELIRRQNNGIAPLVQDKAELEQVFKLIKSANCDSYLEVGTAEGNSLYVLAHALQVDQQFVKKPSIITIDYGEKHTASPRNEIITKLADIVNIKEFLGNSHSSDIIKQVNDLRSFDVVLIDAGHTYTDVIADAVAYGHLAQKYIFFHDVQLPEVKAAFEWYVAQRHDCYADYFINSANYGYGILEVKQ